MKESAELRQRITEALRVKNMDLVALGAGHSHLCAPSASALARRMASHNLIELSSCRLSNIRLLQSLSRWRCDMLRRITPVVSLWLLAPLVAEYLLGSLPVSQIAILPLMAAMYGSGALLIREAARRNGGGWMTIALLGIAYGFIEEGLVTQSLFNPNYLHLRLLDFGYVPALGTGLPWLVFVVTIHAVWSIAVPIGFAEALFPAQRDEALARDDWDWHFCFAVPGRRGRCRSV